MHNVVPRRLRPTFEKAISSGLAALARISCAVVAIAIGAAISASHACADEIEEAIARFETALETRDWPEAASAAARLGDHLDRLEDPKWRPRITAALEKGLDVRGEGVFVAVRSAEAMALAGDAAAPTLAKALRNRRLEKEDELRDLRNALVRSLGITASQKYASVVMKYLPHDDPTATAAAADGIAGYYESPEKLRKKLVESLLSALEVAAKSRETQSSGNRRAVSSAPTDPSKENRWEVVRQPIVDALSSLTNQYFEKLEDWKAWYDENEREPWD